MVTVILIGFFSAVDTSCDCPHEYCMKMPSRPKRCECCIYVYLGKRSSQPMKPHQDSKLVQSTRPFWPPFPGPATNRLSLSKLEDFRGYQDKTDDRAFANSELLDSKPYNEINNKKMVPFYMKAVNLPEINSPRNGVPFTDSSFIFGFSVDDSRDSRNN